MGKHFHIEADSGHDALLAIMAHLNREDMGQAIDLLIDRLDILSGDPDLEENSDDEGPGLFAYRLRDEALSQLPEHRDAALALASEDDEDDDPAEDAGDEQDGSMSEEDFCRHNLAFAGPGCPLSDGGCSTSSGAGDPAWAEWHTRGRAKVGEHGEEQCRTLGGINMAHEDDELDDDDHGRDELGEQTSAEYQEKQPEGGGETFADDDREPDGWSIRRGHRDRLRRTRCDVHTERGYGWTRSTFQVRDEVSA